MSGLSLRLQLQHLVEGEERAPKLPSTLALSSIDPLHAGPAEMTSTLAAVHVSTPPILLDVLLTTRTLPRQPSHLFDRTVFLLRTVLGTQLIGLACLAFMVWPVTRYACFCATLVTDADICLLFPVRFGGLHELVPETASLMTLTRRLLRLLRLFRFMDLSSAASRNQAPTPIGSCVANVL